MAEIHKHIKDCRVACGMTQEQLAQKIFTTRQAVSSYETGRTQPGIDTLELLATAFDVPIEVLLYGDNRKKSRRRLNKAAYIALGIFLLGIFLTSALLWGINYFIPIPPGGISTPRGHEIAILRFSFFDLRDAVGMLAVGFGAIAAIVLLSYDLAIKPKAPLGAKALYFFTVLAGTTLCSWPWSLFDRVYTAPNYMITPIMAMVFFGVLMAIDVAISLVRGWGHKGKTPTK